MIFTIPSDQMDDKLLHVTFTCLKKVEIPAGATEEEIIAIHGKHIKSLKRILLCVDNQETEDLLVQAKKAKLQSEEKVLGDTKLSHIHRCYPNILEKNSLTMSKIISFKKNKE
jgi:hypothetical protein